MEWREQSTVSCDEGFLEAQRWIEAVTKKTFGSDDFRSALENGVLLCDLVNSLKPGIIARVNRLSTPIAGLENINVFLKACGKLGLREAQLFHPGDLQDLSTRVTVKRQETSRRLKNVLITLYWLGRKAQSDSSYDGPSLNLKALEGLLGAALTKALEKSSSHRGSRSSSVRDSGFGDSWYADREELFSLRGRGGGGHRREDSLDSLNSLGSRPHSISSDTPLKGSSEGCSSDAEAESAFRMADKDKESLSYRRSLIVQPKTTTQFNQFLPTKDKASGYVPAPLRKKRAERNEDNRRSWANPEYTDEDGTFSRESRAGVRAGVRAQDYGRPSQSSTPATLQWAYEYESGSDSDADRPDPDLVHDDLASRRFHSSSPAPPTNFALPVGPPETGTAGGRGATWPKVPAASGTPPPQTATCLSRGPPPSPRCSSVTVDHQRAPPAGGLRRQTYDDSEDEDEVGYADPVQDDLYARKVGLSPQHAASAPHDKFLPKFWTPEEDTRVHKIKLGSQRRPWYKKIQGFSRKKSGSSSSSDDSECDVSPWLSSAPSPSAPSPSHPHTPEGSAYAGRPSGPSLPSLHTPPHTTPQTSIQLPLHLVRPPLVFAKMDPTSGPRLVKCESHPLLGRQDPLEPPEPHAGWDDLDPDLENDDMFARRTQAFHANTSLALMKTRVHGSRSPGLRYSSEPELSIVTQPRPAGSAGTKARLPDVERDDVLYRKVHPRQAPERQRPLSEVHFAPMAVPEPWALPPSLQARLLCPPCPLTREACGDGPDEEEKEEPPVTDDMSLRKLGSGPGGDRGQRTHGGPSPNQGYPSLPTSCSEGDLRKMQSIREASRLRYKKKLMVERVPRRRDSSDGSKSMSDILSDPAVLREVRYEELQKIRERVKETDDQWQDDLTKWKNRRKSVNSDIVKKKEEREQIEQITLGGPRRARTLRDGQTEGRKTLGSRLSSLSLLDQDVFEDPVPIAAPRTRNRTLPARSHTVDVPYSSPTASPEPPLRKARAPAAASEVPRPASPPPARDADTVDNLVDLSTTTTSSSSQRSIFNSYSSTLVPTERSTSPAHRRSPSPTPALVEKSSSPELRRSASPTPFQRSASPDLRRSASPTPYQRSSSPDLGRNASPTPFQKSVSPLLRRSVSPAPTPAEGTTSSAKTEWTPATSTATSTSALSSASGAREPSRPWASRPAEAEAPSAEPPYKKPPFSSMEPKAPATSQVSASLPRSYQRSDSARIASVVAPRPFGTQATRLASLPRAYTMDDSHKRVSVEAGPKKPAFPTCYSQFMTAEEKAASPSSSDDAEGEDEEEEEEEEERSATPTPSVSPVPPQVNAPATPSPPKEKTQGSYSDMRISLNQKPNSSRDFGFQADWDSTGAHITSIQPGSSAEMCQLLVGDEVLAVNAHRVADMSYVQWKASLDQALQQGSLVVDVRRHGNAHWERNQASLPFKSHKTINLTSMDPPMPLGALDTNTGLKPSLDFTSRIPKETTFATKEAPNHPIIDMVSNGVNGSFGEQPGTLRSKDSEPMSLKNLKRRSEFFEQGGSESAMPDLAVPSIGPPSNRWSWDPEEERRRQEKWQKEQDRLLQEKYKRDQEKMEEEWRKAQLEVVTLGSTQPQVQSSPEKDDMVAPSSLKQASEDREKAQEEERKKRERKLEEERQAREEQERQRREAERKKREEEERELRRLQEERKRREKQEEEEKRKLEEEQRWQRKRDEELAEERRRQERAQELQQWGEEAYGRAKVRSELSLADRGKSKSTPQLDVDDHEYKGSYPGLYGRAGGMAQQLLEDELRRKRDQRTKGLRAASELELERRNILNAMRYRQPERASSSGEPPSWARDSQKKGQAELERQQILQEMKKKTNLVTDNSWIRQRSISTATAPKEHLGLAGLIRRGESLDNLDVPHSSNRSSWTSGSTSSIPNYSRPQSALPANPFSYGGAAGPGSRPGSATLPSSYSMGSLRQGAGPAPSWSQRSSPPTSLSPAASPGPGHFEDPAAESSSSLEQRSRSVSGKKICTFCDIPLGKGAAMIIESLGLCYHLSCFKCIDCKCDLGGSEAGAEVRIRNRQLYCNSCYVRVKSGQPTSM